MRLTSSSSLVGDSHIKKGHFLVLEHRNENPSTLQAANQGLTLFCSVLTHWKALVTLQKA
jgi:hypothetical protein